MNLRVPALAASLLLAGCVGLSTQDSNRIQVVTFPTNADIELNGRRLGEAPVLIEVPRDAEGQVTRLTMIRAIPKTTNQFVQVREITPGRTNPVPLRIMIDMRLTSTNEIQASTDGELARRGSQGPPPSEPTLSPRARANQIIIGVPLR